MIAGDVLIMIELQNHKVKLERANADNIDVLIEWTLDPLAQGPYKIHRCIQSLLIRRFAK